MPRSMDESSSSAPTPEPLERKMTRSLLALSNDEMTIPRQLAAIAPREPPAPSRAEDTPSPPARRRSWHPKEEPRTPSIGTAGMALGLIWGGSLFAYSSDPNAGLGPILGKGRLFFFTLAVLAVINSRLASRLPPWPQEAGQDWRYEFFRCRRTSLQRLPAPCGAVA